MTQQHYNYIEALEKKSDAYDRLFKHYNNRDSLALADFILNDEYYNGGDEEECSCCGDEEE